MLIDEDVLGHIVLHSATLSLGTLRDTSRALRRLTTAVRGHDLADLLLRRHCLRKWTARWRTKPILVLTHSWRRRPRSECAPIMMM